MLYFLFFIGTLFVSVNADGYKCAQALINPPMNLSEPYYFPEGWNESMEPAKYAPSQMCNWQINVPNGMYATVVFYKNTESESGIKCTYPDGQKQYIEDKELNPYIFTSPQFQVDLQVSEKQGEFSFKVVWSEYPGACKINNELGDTKGLAAVPSQCVTTFTAPNKAMLVGFSLKDDLDVSLRQSAVYEGDSVNGKYLGNLYYARYNQIVSPSNKLTIYTFGLYKEFNYTLYMGMDTRAAGDVQQFNGMNCPSDPNKVCYITLNAYYNISAVATIGRQPDFLKQFFQFPKESTLKIYENQISDSNLLATVDQSNYMSMFPMEVKNSLKIYHLNTGRLSIPVAKNSDDAQYSTVFDGRYVNIHSFDYRMTSFDQDTSESFITENNQKMYFQFKTKYFDVNGPTTLEVSVTNNGKVVFSDTFTGTHLPPKDTTKALGDKMTVVYKTYGNYTKGFELDLITSKTDDVSSSTTQSPSNTHSTTLITTQTSTLSPKFSTSSIKTSSKSSEPTKTTMSLETSFKTSTAPVLSTKVTQTSSNPNSMITKSATFSKTPSITSSAPIEITTELQTFSKYSTVSDSPIPGVSTTTVGSNTRGTTEKYETTTKSGINQFSLFSFIFVLFIL